MRILKQITKYSILYVTGGIAYYCIEVIWRGYSHISMFILGGLCFILIGLVSKHERNILKQLAISCLIITVLELIFGLVLNVKLGLGVWDYSNFRFNYKGQICLAFSIIWFLLSWPAIILYDYILYWIFGEERPSHKLI